jgi:hypothetical protein
VGVICHPSHDLRVGCLDQESADAPDEAGDISHDLPGDRIGTQQARIAGVIQCPRHGVIGVGEEAGGPAHDAASEALQRID